MVKKKEEIGKNEIAPMQENLPAYVKNAGAGRGRENIDKADLVLPRIKLIQPLSPEVEEKGIKPGNFVNSLTGKDIGSSMIIIPVNHFKSRIYWRPRDEEGPRILCSSSNGLVPSNNDFSDTCATCEQNKWNNKAKTTKDKAPKCSIQYNFVVLIEGCNEPVGLAMEKTKIKAAKKLLSLAAYIGGNLDMFARKYKVTTVKEKNEMGSWFNLDIEPAGFVSEVEFHKAEKVYESLRNLSVAVETEDGAEESA